MNKNQEYQIGVHIDVPKELSDKIVTVQSESGLVHPSGDLKPHITLYYGRFLEENFESLVEELRNIELKIFSISVKEVKRHDDSYPNSSFFCLELEDTGYIEQLHKKIIESANPLRGDLLRSKDILRKERGELSEKELEYLEKYGSYRVMDNFRSHITLGVCNKSDKKCDGLLVNFEKGFEEVVGVNFEVDNMVVVSYVYDNEENKIISELDRRIIEFKK